MSSLYFCFEYIKVTPTRPFIRSNATQTGSEEVKPIIRLQTDRTMKLKDVKKQVKLLIQRPGFYIFKHQNLSRLKSNFIKYGI